MQKIASDTDRYTYGAAGVAASPLSLRDLEQSILNNLAAASNQC